MQPSDGVRQAVLRYFECATEGDVGGFDRVLTGQPTAIVIGTGPGERTEGRDRWLEAFGHLVEALPGLRLEPGEVRGWEEGSLGWAVADPTWVFPDGGSMQTRATLVARLEDGEWKIVHAHFSAGVPDEEIVELQARWLG